MKRIAYLGLIGLFSTMVWAQDDMKIGVVDLERVVNEVSEGVAVKAELKKKYEAKQAILDKKQDEAQKLKDALEGSGAAVMKPEAKQAKFTELQKKAGEVQQLYMTMQQEMQKDQQEAMGAIMEKANAIFQQIGKEGDYTLLLNKSQGGVLFAKSGLDLTEEVIRRYNAAYKAKAAPKTPKKK